MHWVHVGVFQGVVFGVRVRQGLAAFCLVLQRLARGNQCCLRMSMRRARVGCLQQTIAYKDFRCRMARAAQLDYLAAGLKGLWGCVFVHPVVAPAALMRDGQLSCSHTSAGADTTFTPASCRNGLPHCQEPGCKA